MLDDNSLKTKRIIDDIESTVSDLIDWKFEGFEDKFYRINRAYGQIRNSAISTSATSRALILFVQNKKLHLKNNNSLEDIANIGWAGVCSLQAIEDRIKMLLNTFYLKKGDYYCEKGRLEEALDMWEQALKTEPDNEYIHFMLEQIIKQYESMAERASFLRQKYYIKKIQFRPAVKLFSPRVLLYDGNGYLYISEDGDAQFTHRFIKLSVDGGEAKVLSTNRFYTGLWQEKRSKFIYASLSRIGDARVSMIDVLDPEGRIIETIDISTEKLGSVYGPQRISGDDSGNLYLVDRYTDRLIRYQYRDFTGCEIFELRGLRSIYDLILAEDKIYVADQTQDAIGSVCTRTKKVSLTNGHDIHSPRRLAYDPESKEMFVICNTNLLKLDTNFNVIYKYNLGHSFIRDIQFINGCGTKRMYMATDDNGLSCYLL